MNATARTTITISAALMMSLLANGVSPAAQTAKGKPRPPVGVTITPAPQGQAVGARKPGDAVELMITATAETDATEMRIKCRLGEGVELMTGNIEWSGPAAKGEERSMYIAVRSKHGQGTVSCRVELYAGQDLLFTSGAEHEFGMQEKDKPVKPHAVRKDRKGQTVEEYR